MNRQITSSGSVADILLVEDNPGDVRLLTELFSDAQITNPIHVVTDGREAIDFVRQRGDFADEPRPDIVLLDWHLPQVGGEEVLRRLDDEFDLDRIFVIVLTGSRRELESVLPSDLSADGYLSKPVDPDEFCSLVSASDDFSLRNTCSSS